MVVKHLFSYLKRFKPVHWAYNLLHLKNLRHNQEAYKRYSINKPLFGSISSRDFPDRASRAWLDCGDSRELAPAHPSFAQLPAALQEQVLNWSQQGYILWKSGLPEERVDAINAAIDQILAKGQIAITHDNKLPFANRLSDTIRNTTCDPEILSVLQFLLGKEVVPFQTLNFIKGSNQRAHSDSIHMTTYPLGYLIAVWIALEDTNEKSGPLFYYPGSHRLPYLLNNDFEQTSSLLQLGKKDYRDYEDVVEEILQRNTFEQKIFLAKKGDLFIWHANLIHGGLPIVDHSLTRKSMVIHYYAKDVIKYHEITERPSLMQD